MRHHNSVFHGLLQHVPWGEFDRLVEAHGSDARVRRLTTKSQFVALLYGQLSGASSLREIVGGLESHATRLYHLGAAPARRSTLADANGLRPCGVFADLLAAMIGRAHRGLRRKIGETTYLIDSTGVRLNGFSESWARFSAANVNDITVAQTMPITPGATYVFDLAYYDYAWWARLDAAACRIVTRFKKNTPLTVVAELPLPKGSDILSDRVGTLPDRMARSRLNPFRDPVREVRVKTETGKVLRILSNDLDATAQEIADLYKRRWQIELFFRWVKQTLKITRFLGTSENAVRSQIAVALIAFLLLRLAQQTQDVIASPLAFTRLVRANLMLKKPIGRLLEPEPPPFTDPRQMILHSITA